MHAGLFVRSGDGILRENIPSCGGKNKGQFTALLPLPLPRLYASRLREEHYLDWGSGTTRSCWQGFGEKSSAAGLVLHHPLLCASAPAPRLTKGKAVWSLGGAEWW